MGEEKRREGEEEEEEEKRRKEKRKARVWNVWNFCMEIVWVCIDYVWIISKEKSVWNGMEVLLVGLS